MARPLRGEMWWCEPPQIGRRPVVVLSRDAAIPRLRRALVAPCTTTIRGLSSEVVLEPSATPAATSAVTSRGPRCPVAHGRRQVWSATNEPRDVPAVGDVFAVFTSAAGDDDDPAWFRNVVAIRA